MNVKDKAVKKILAAYRKYTTHPVPWSFSDFEKAIDVAVAEACLTSVVFTLKQVQDEIKTLRASVLETLKDELADAKHQDGPS